ncbi:unnamed protein product [Paramecium octaurelia]|uniref:Uncharacterized protein n=1 Tax=Paramecium octaurelia TaxID=43137 RepID=A0A8S1SB26_PAROT|nr:unnamed protein product [Paramecium octaurelia]
MNFDISSIETEFHFFKFLVSSFIQKLTSTNKIDEQQHLILQNISCDKKLYSDLNCIKLLLFFIHKQIGFDEQLENRYEYESVDLQPFHYVISNCDCMSLKFKLAFTFNNGNQSEFWSLK